MLKHYRVQSIINTFIAKLKRNLVGRQPAYEEKSENEYTIGKLMKWFFNTEGTVLSKLHSTVLASLGILLVVSLSVGYSIMMVFPYFDPSNSTVKIFQILYLLQLVLEMLTNITTKRYEQGQALQFLNEISYNYLKNGFIVDFINLLLLLIEVFPVAEVSHIKYLRMVIVFKLPGVIQKMQTL